MKNLLLLISMFIAQTALAGDGTTHFELRELVGKKMHLNFSIPIDQQFGSSYTTTLGYVCIVNGKIEQSYKACESPVYCQVTLDAKQATLLQPGMLADEIQSAQGTRGFYFFFTFSEITLMGVHSEDRESELRLYAIQCMKNRNSNWTVKEIQRALGDLVIFE